MAEDDHSFSGYGPVGEEEHASQTDAVEGTKHHRLSVDPFEIQGAHIARRGSILEDIEQNANVPAQDETADSHCGKNSGYDTEHGPVSGHKMPDRPFAQRAS
jgi:hypothetical protein